MTQEEKNKEIVRRFYDEVWNKGDLAVVDELFIPNYVVVHLPPWRTPGAEGLKQFIADNHRMFPDVHQTIEDMVAEGDQVAVYLKATATHKGDLNGPVGLVPATNKKVSWEGVIFLKLKNGKIVETKGVIDNMSLMQQLGAVQKP
jgi:steroid delta-isomerase-like uncharacterized protein